MAQSIKIEDELLETIRQDAARESRSLAGQAEYYIRLGRAIARSPDFDRDQIELALSGGIEVQELTLEEQEAFFVEFAAAMEKQGAGNSNAFWEERRRRGLGVGELPDGTKVRQLAGGAVQVY